ncbi:DUF7519 family protein [Haloparvum sp. AD34]
MTDHPTAAMTALAFLFGGVAVLTPLASLSPLLAGVVVATAVVAVVSMQVTDLSVRGSNLLFIVLAPLLGICLLASTVVHVDLLAVARNPGAADLFRVGVGALGGFTGALSFATLSVGARRLLSLPNVARTWRNVGRVFVALLLASVVSFGITSTGVPASAAVPFHTAISEFRGGEPRIIAMGVFFLASLIPPLAGRAYDHTRRVAATPVEAISLDVEVEASDASNGTSVADPIDGGTTSNSIVRRWSRKRIVVVATVSALCLAFLRPVLARIAVSLGNPSLTPLVAVNDALVAATAARGTVDAVLAALVSLLAILGGATAVNWARTRVDRQGKLLGPTSSVALAVGGVSLALHLAAPAYRPVVGRQIAKGAAPVPTPAILDALPALVLGGATAATGLTVGLLSVWLVYGHELGDGTDTWLVYRNLVLLLSTFTVLSAAANDVMPALLFGSIVAALLAWDFLEYGYGLSVEVRSRSLQPPELAHAAASVGVGVLLVGGSVGAYEASRSFSPPSEVSFLAVPVLVVSSTLLLLYFND